MREAAGDLRVPRLGVGCRVRRLSDEETMLLVPEGALRLTGAASEIVSLVDGARTVAAITFDLQQRYAGDDASRIATEVQQFFEKLHARSLLLFSV